ncbi:hypothetical protein J6590_043018, partial [Homalodisca vitripennis]
YYIQRGGKLASQQCPNSIYGNVTSSNHGQFLANTSKGSECPRLAQTHCNELEYSIVTVKNINVYYDLAIDWRWEPGEL